ncbi:MAG: hypothetical protein AB8U44_03725 [Aaplasma endosymbiont of Hyalomma asiaticum]
MYEALEIILKIAASARATGTAIGENNRTCGNSMLKACCGSSVLKKAIRYDSGTVTDKADKIKKVQFCFAVFFSSSCFLAYECMYNTVHGIVINSKNKGIVISTHEGVSDGIHKNEDAPNVKNDRKTNPTNERIKIMVISTRIIAIIAVKISLVR